MDIFKKYFASGILEANIRQFGGEECYQEIPPLYHYLVSFTFAITFLLCLRNWGHTLIDFNQKIPKLLPNLFEKVYLAIGFICLLFAIYYKVSTKRGFFIFNPCHISLALLLVLLYTKDNSSQFIRKFHTAWSGWLFGAVAAFLFPHLEDITFGEFILYYVEHLIILPLGPLVLHRRYGVVRPTFRNQMCAFGTILIYQQIFLMLIGRWFKINLNFALCHSPEQPFFPLFGYHYYTIQTFILNLVSFIVRWACYIYVTMWFSIKSQITLRFQKWFGLKQN